MRLLIALCLLGGVFCDSVFRFGAVLSTEGPMSEMEEAKNGYELYFNLINSNGGLLLGGRPDSKSFNFSFEFLWREDYSDANLHREEVEDLLEDVHFLGGSHPAYAADEMRRSNEKNVLNYHCCVGPDVFYENGYQYVFGVTASNKEYTRMYIRTLALTEVGSIGLIYQNDNIFTRTTCEAAESFANEIGAIRSYSGTGYSKTFSSEEIPKGNETEYFKSIAEEAKDLGVDAVVACVFPLEGKYLVDSFNDIKYPLRTFFLTTGPTKQDWVDSFDPHSRANDLLSAAQWHRAIQYSDDFFGTSLEYSELYEDMFTGQVATYVAAGASAVGVTLGKALVDAFSECDITKTEGDVDRLLYDETAIDCDGNIGTRGYDRLLNALAALDMETFFGQVKFNYFQRNIALAPITTQVFERKAAIGSPYREIEAVLPLGYATELLKYPAKNYYKEKCKPGFYVTDDEFNPCEPCGKGEMSDIEDAPHCNSCPIGQWTNHVAADECMDCPEGTTTHIRGATRRQDCTCHVGYHNLLQMPGVECEPCPDGATCAGGTAKPVAKDGHWTTNSSRNVIYQCEPSTVCKGGDNVTCAEGHTGRLCFACADGYFSVINRCYKCFNKGLVVILCLFLLLGWYIINVTVSRSVASVEMVLGWAQLANIIGDVNLNWTDKVNKMFGIANLFDFDVDILEPTCLFPWAYRANFMTQLCLPFLMTLMGCSGYLGASIAYLMIQKKWLKTDGKLHETLSWIVDIPKDEEGLRKKWDYTIATFLASVDITYVTISKYCFDVFKCEEVGGESVLRVDPTVVCKGGYHKSMLVISSFAIVFYVFGYLGYICWKLYDLRHRRDFSNPVNLRRYGFIYEKYELDYWYTPAIMLVRKLLFVLTLVYMNNPAFQVGTLAIIINASLMIHVYTAPYVDTYLDVLFNFLLLALMFEAFGGLMFYSDNLPSDNRNILEWIILLTLLLLVCVFLVFFVQEVMTKYHIGYLKNLHRQFGQEQLMGEVGKSKKSSPRLRISSTFNFGSLSPLGPFVNRPEDSRISYELLDTFKPKFVYSCLKNRPDYIEDWDRLTNMLKHYMSDQSETSYLSMNPIAKFWRKLVDRFPEVVDFLAVADDETRKKFNDFATDLYRNFYLTNKITPLPLMEVMNWRDYAPMAQWLAIAPSDDREFFLNFVVRMFKAAGHEESAITLEAKLKHGGEDPLLQARASAWKQTGRQRRIMASLTEGSHPFQNLGASNRKGREELRLKSLNEAGDSLPGEDRNSNVEMASIGQASTSITDSNARPNKEQNKTRRQVSFADHSASGDSIEL